MGCCWSPYEVGEVKSTGELCIFNLNLCDLKRGRSAYLSETIFRAMSR
jgi:hypothetical protein